MITQVSIFVAIIIVLIIFIYIIPVDIFYYLPLLISIIGSLLISVLIYFGLKSFSVRTTVSGLIAIVFSVITCIVFLQNFYNRLNNILINEGVKNKANIFDKQIKSGRFYEHHYIYYSYYINGKEHKSSELVNTDLYNKYEKGQIIQILFLARKPKISIISKN